MKVLLTGSSGFLGSYIIKYLKKFPIYDITLLVREYDNQFEGISQISFFDIEKKIKNNIKINNFDVLIHCAGLAHVATNKNFSSAKKYKVSNLDLTKLLIKFTKSLKIKKFVFLSTINVHSTKGNVGKISEETSLEPSDYYALSKIKCENVIKRAFHLTETKYVIIRPTVIYDQNSTKNKGNIGRIQNFIFRYGFFVMPINSGKRSYTSIDNVCSFIEFCLNKSNIDNNTYIISDSIAYKICEFIQLLASAQNKKVLCVKLPDILFKFIMILLRKSSVSKKMFSNHIVSIDKALNTGWCENKIGNNGE